MATRMIQRRGTAAEWTAANPVLAAGEIGFETDTTKFKFGDGTTAWADIAYFASADQLIDGAPELLNTLNELAEAIGDDEDFIGTINAKIDSKAGLQVSDSAPTTGPDGSESLQEGDFWYDRANGHLYTYFDIDGSNYVWVETGGSDDYVDTALGTNNHDFPTSPSDGDTHKGYIYDSSRTAWQIDRSFNIDDAANVTITSAAADEILMFDGTDTWENVPGVRLDSNGEIPTSYTTPLQTLIEAKISVLTVQTTAEWATDTSIPPVGSLNVETASGILLKLGNGTDTYANLPYVPTQASVTADIASALADYATKADPTFSGTVSLPSTTSIGNVDATEIAHLDGVTSGIQGQLDSLDTLKAPLADPTFTGTVSGVTKSMVGLGNVDNTSDADKPVSTATQAALDLKANLAGATFTGDVTVDTNLVVDGNFTVNGTNFSASATSITIEDNIVQLAHQNAANTVDLGLVVAYNDGTAGHAGIVRDVSDDTWKLFKGVATEPATTVAFGEGSLDNLALNNLTAAGVVFTDGTQTKAGVPSITGFTQVNDEVQVATITNVVGDGNLATITTSADHGFSELDTVVIADVVDASYNGTYTVASTPTSTTFTVANVSQEAFTSGGTATVTTPGNYTLDTLDHQDNIVEMNSSSAVTFTIPTDAALAWPVGASMDIFAAGTGEVTIAGDDGVTVNATPGLILRTQWSSATILKRGANSWVVYGDLKA